MCTTYARSWTHVVGRIDPIVSPLCLQWLGSWIFHFKQKKLIKKTIYEKFQVRLTDLILYITTFMIPFYTILALHTCIPLVWTVLLCCAFQNSPLWILVFFAALKYDVVGNSETNDCLRERYSLLSLCLMSCVCVSLFLSLAPFPFLSPSFISFLKFICELSKKNNKGEILFLVLLRWRLGVCDRWK